MQADRFPLQCSVVTDSHTNRLPTVANRRWCIQKQQIWIPLPPRARCVAWDGR